MTIDAGKRKKRKGREPLKPQSSTKLRVGAATVAQLENPNYEEWDDEELIRGTRYDKNGRFGGRPPKVIPLGLLYELNRRMATHGVHKLNAALLPSIEYLCSVADGTCPPEEVDKVRVSVCESVINRILGMNPQRVELTTIEPSVWEKEGVTKAIVVRDVIDVESEEWDNPYE